MSRGKEISIFIAVLVGIVVTFAIGVLYLRAQASHEDLLANVVSVVPPAPTKDDTTTAAVIVTATSTATTTPVMATTTPTSTIIATTTKPKPPVKASVPKPAATTTVTTIKTITPVPPAPTPTITAPTPASTPAPDPTPKPVISAPINFPYTEGNFTNDTNWKKTWGAVTINKSGDMQVGAIPSNNGGTVYLANVENANAWTDYTFTATVDWSSGERFSLFARYVDGNNYVYCQFDEQYLGTVYMDLIQRMNGQEYNIATADILNYNILGGTNIQVSISTNGSQATCKFDGRVLSNTDTGNTLNPPYGGTVGFTTWDGDRNNSDIVVKKVSVAKNY